MAQERADMQLDLNDLMRRAQKRETRIAAGDNRLKELVMRWLAAIEAYEKVEAAAEVELTEAVNRSLERQALNLATRQKVEYEAGKGISKPEQGAAIDLNALMGRQRQREELQAVDETYDALVKNYEAAQSTLEKEVARVRSESRQRILHSDEAAALRVAREELRSYEEELDAAEFENRDAAGIADSHC